MDDLRFSVLFNSISVILERWADANERLCAMEPRLRLRKFRLERGSNPGYSYLEPNKRNILGKQCRPRSDAT